MAKVICEGKEYYFDDGVKLVDVAKKVAGQDADDIMLAFLNGRLRELHKTINGVNEVKFITTKTSDGQRAYRRSVIFLLQRALMDCVPDVSLGVEHTLGQGYFCKVHDHEQLSEDDLAKVKARMLKLVELNLPIKKYSIKTAQASELFGRYNMSDKEKLLKYRTSSNINVYDLDGCIDYFYGYMAPSTGVLKYFDLQKFEDGFMLLLPDKSNPCQVAPFKERRKLFEVQQTANKWGTLMDVHTVGALNDAIASGRIKEIILSQEAIMERNIGKLAETIAADPKKKFVMIAGPSSSGKTTFSHRLSAQLRAQGVTPHPIALDNYYLNRDQMPLDEFGQKDFECIEGLDIAQFNKDMVDLLEGKRVELPSFNFKIGKREYNGNYMQLGANDVLVIEGIHGLNDRMSESLPAESKFRIYISALTQLSIDEHNPLPTTDGRLIRRIVRDARTRGTSAAETIAMWDSVRRGEEKNIFPFQEQADYMFNSALIYEMAVLKLYVTPHLYNIPKDDPMYQEAKRLIKLLDYVLPMAPDDIPNNSLVREFIGGSCIDVS